MEIVVGLVAVCIAAGIPVAMILSALKERERQEEAAFWRPVRASEATDRGWVRIGPVPSLVETATAIFQRGHGGACFTGKFRGRTLYVLDYSYAADSSNSSKIYHVFLVSLILGVHLPSLRATPVGLRAEPFDGPDLEFESNAFNDAFRIQCKDKRYASAVLHPRMMQCMLRHPGLAWQIRDRAIVTWGANPFEVEDVVARLKAMHELAELIPDFVLKDYGQPTS